MAQYHSNTAQHGPVPGQAAPVASIKVEEGAASQMNGKGLPKSVVAKNGSAAATQTNGGPISPQGGGFEMTFPMANDIHTAGPQGIAVTTGHPSGPFSFSGNYRDIVKQAVPTQYTRGTGMTFDFEEHMQDMEAHDFEEDVKDHEEYEFVGNDSQEDLLATSETDNGPSTSFKENVYMVFTRWMHLRPRSKNAKVPMVYHTVRTA